MILCWLQFHVFAVTEPFQIAVSIRCPLPSPFSTSFQAVYKPNGLGPLRGAEPRAEGPSFRLQGPGVGVQGGLSSAGAGSPSAASAAAATAFCFGMHGK